MVDFSPAFVVLTGTIGGDDVGRKSRSLMLRYRMSSTAIFIGASLNTQSLMLLNLTVLGSRGDDVATEAERSGF